jgi:hypothetical protein
MTLNLRNIRQTTHTKPEKLSPERSSNTFSDTRLADAWWADETDDFALDCPT